MQNYPAFGSRWKTLWHLSNDSGFSQPDIVKSKTPFRPAIQPLCRHLQLRNQLTVTFARSLLGNLKSRLAAAGIMRYLIYGSEINWISIHTFLGEYCMSHVIHNKYVQFTTIFIRLHFGLSIFVRLLNWMRLFLRKSLKNLNHFMRFVQNF